MFHHFGPRDFFPELSQFWYTCSRKLVHFCCHYKETILKRSCKTCPRRKKKKKQKCAWIKWHYFKVYKSIFEWNCFKMRACLLQDIGHWFTRNKNNEIILLSSTILITVFPKFYSLILTELVSSEQFKNNTEFCKECILQQIHLSLQQFRKLIYRRQTPTVVEHKWDSCHCNFIFFKTRNRMGCRQQLLMPKWSSKSAQAVTQMLCDICVFLKTVKLSCNSQVDMGVSQSYTPASTYKRLVSRAVSLLIKLVQPF